MRIEELHLKNFRCFKELYIKFPASNLAVFIGLNGSGKTAILDAILLLLNNYQKRNKNFYTLDDIYTGSPLTENKIIFNLRDDFKTWRSDSNYEEITNANIRLSLEKVREEQLATEYFFCAYYKTDRKNNHVLGGYNSDSTNFIDFDEWFKNEEDLENELQRYKKDFNFTTPRLDVIRKAIITFLSNNITGADFSDLKVKRNIKDRNIIGSQKEEIDKHSFDLCITHNKKELKLSQLSEGQRLLLHTVGDIAYQIVKVNNVFDSYGLESVGYINNNETYSESEILDILKTSGVILIDEIELHLHPQWQREVLPALQKTFPNIQFIVTTHSPQVLSRVHKDDIFILNNNEIYKPSSNPIGRDANDILEEIMEVTKRPKEIQDLSDQYFSLINKNLFDEAREIRNQLVEKLDKDDPIFIRADAMITRKQLLRK